MADFLGDKKLNECLQCGILTKNKKFCSYQCHYESMTYEKDLTT